MYGNNFGYPFMGGMPNQMIPPMTRNIVGPAMSPLNRGISQGGGLRSLLGLGRAASPGGLASRGFSFSNLLNGAAKTLGVVRDAIPVVKEIGPMMNNMKSMLKIASVFKDETDTKEKKEETSSNINNNDQNNITNKEKTDYSYNQSNNSPNFFL
ncbi:MAG: VrrA/YqfQ family protein [Bacilli bacterium]